MKIRYYLRNIETGEIVPVHFKGLECYHLSFVHFEWREMFLPLIFWDEWDKWERYVPTRAERLAVKARDRLAYLRGELRDEHMSYGELAELQSLTKYIESGDVELQEAAEVPESEAW